MRAALAAFAAVLSLTASHVQAQTQAEKPTPQLTVFPKAFVAPSDEPPGVVRGDATRRGTIDGRFGSAFAPARFDIGAGDRLWLTDPFSGQVFVCDVRRTNRVGSRFIGCLEGRLPFALSQ